MNTTTELQFILSSYSAQQHIGTLDPEIEVREDQAIKGGEFYPFKIFGPWISEEWKNQTSFDIFQQFVVYPDLKIHEEAKEDRRQNWRLDEIKIIHQAKQWQELHKEKILKDYKGKYIAIILNPQKELNTPLKEAIIGSAKDFHELASKVYKKYGHRTIYMPFVDIKERVIRIPSPRIKIL